MRLELEVVDGLRVGLYRDKTAGFVRRGYEEEGRRGGEDRYEMIAYGRMRGGLSVDFNADADSRGPADR